MKKNSVHIVIYFKKGHGCLAEKWFKNEDDAKKFQDVTGGSVCKVKVTEKQYDAAE